MDRWIDGRTDRQIDGPMDSAAIQSAGEELKLDFNNRSVFWVTALLSPMLERIPENINLPTGFIDRPPGEEQNGRENGSRSDAPRGARSRDRRMSVHSPAATSVRRRRRRSVLGYFNSILTLAQRQVTTELCVLSSVLKKILIRKSNGALRPTEGFIQLTRDSLGLSAMLIYGAVVHRCPLHYRQRRC